MTWNSHNVEQRKPDTKGGRLSAFYTMHVLKVRVMVTSGGRRDRTTWASRDPVMLLFLNPGRNAYFVKINCTVYL